MLQEFVQKSTRKVLNTIEIAISELVALKQNVLIPDFILLALLSQPDAEAVKIIERVTPEPIDTIAQIKAQLYRQTQQAAPAKTMQIVGSGELSNLFRSAGEEAKNLGDEYIATGTLFIAMLDPKVGTPSQILQQAGITRERAIKALKDMRGGRSISSQDAETEANVLEKYRK